jgi:hypothetical protein
VERANLGEMNLSLRCSRTCAIGEATAMKIFVRPILDPKREIDLTHRLVSAIAEELWQLFGGNETLNWIEAEWHLQRIIAQARTAGRQTAEGRAATSAPDPAMRETIGSARRERSDTRSPRSHRLGTRRRRNAHSGEGAANWNADVPQIAGAVTVNA